MTEQIAVEKLWEQTRQMLQEGPANPPLWDAAAAVQPITVDQNTVVLGLPAGQMRHASYLETAVNKSSIQQILKSLTGQDLDVRVITGTTQQDWQRLKQREQASMDTTTTAARAQVAGQAAVNVWREAGQQVINIFTGTRARAHSIHLAQLLVKALPLIWETEQQARLQAPEAEEVHSQQLDRILERVATYCNLPPPVVALEYLRYRSAKDKVQQHSSQ